MIFKRALGAVRQKGERESSVVMMSHCKLLLNISNNKGNLNTEQERECLEAII